MAFEIEPRRIDQAHLRPAVRLPWLRRSSTSRSGRKSAASTLPDDVPAEKVDKGPFNASPSHGLGVAPDGKTLWVTSRPNARVYAYSLPDLKLLPDPSISVAGPTG